jgi:hypothetical protein
MRRRDVLGWLGSAAVVHPLSVRAQQARKIPRIGFLGAISAPRYVRQVEALRSGLRDLGYFEGECSRAGISRDLRILALSSV